MLTPWAFFPASARDRIVLRGAARKPDRPPDRSPPDRPRQAKILYESPRPADPWRARSMPGFLRPRGPIVPGARQRTGRQIDGRGGLGLAERQRAEAPQRQRA